jgi:hypothetical protein
MPCALFLFVSELWGYGEEIPVKSEKMPLKRQCRETSEECRVAAFMAVMGSEKERKAACAE